MKKMGPHYICIGAPRCGTTWMYENLNRHPQIQPLPGKELKFLNGTRTPEEKAARIRWWGRRWRRTYAKAPAEREWGAKWLERFSQPESFDVYETLFETPPGKVAGDMTPNFCRMPAAKVRDIRNKLGDVRVFMMVRDPIERDWSDAQLALQHHKTAVQQSDDAYIDYIASRGCQTFSNYPRAIDTWGSLFSHFAFFYFDDIINDPNGMMKRVCEFVGIDPNPPEFTVSRVAPNPTSVEIGNFVRSQNIYEAQKRISEPLMGALKSRFDGYPAAWYHRHYGAAPG
jgi:hypothetical protein